jgi:acetylornithine deacetylase
MDHPTRVVATLAQDLVRIDSRSSVSNLELAGRLERELTSFEVERIPYVDDEGLDKVVLIATRGRGGIAFSGHMDTVPDTGWLTDPWSGRIEDDELFGLGATDMKGPVAALVVAAQSLPGRIPIALVLTTDEETTKAGARAAVTSELLRRYDPNGILVAEPTGLAPVRGHRAHIEFIATATGQQAHSSTGRGRNANWDLVPFLVELRKIYDRLRTDTALLDAAYDPPFSDFNPVIDNFGAAVNVAVPKAVVRVKFRGARRRRRLAPALDRKARGQAAGAAGDAPADRHRDRAHRPPGAHRPLRHRRVGAAGRRPLRRHGPRRHRRRAHAA